MLKLHRIDIKGFKSIRHQELKFDQLNIFIGSNGAGKSNLVGAFNFLRQVATQNLNTYVGVAGGANSILHFGRKKTSSLSFEIEFEVSNH